MDWLTEL